MGRPRAIRNLGILAGAKTERQMPGANLLFF
jgi:hypothetical protein